MQLPATAIAAMSWRLESMQTIMSPKPRSFSLPVLFAEHPFENLARRIARNRLGEDHLFGQLVARQPGATELDDLLLVDLALVGDDDGARDLAPLLVGQADDRHLADAGDADHDALDLRRIDVLAAGNDHVLQAILDVEITFVVDLADVAGAKPAVIEGFARGIRAVPIFLEQEVGLDNDLALPALADHAVVGAHSDVREHARASGRTDVAQGVFTEQHGAATARFGERIALQDLHVLGGIHLDQGLGHGR